MKSKTLWWAVRTIAVLVLAVAAGTLAQDTSPVHFSGTINDFTAQTGTIPPTVGPWEMHGVWSLTLNERTGTADFTAAMTMQEGDLWLLTNSEDPTQDPFVRGPHTHHITLKGAAVSYDTSACPTNAPPTTGRFVVSGLADITGNGNVAPFQKKSGLSKLYVCITGGTDVQFSNVTLQFESGSPATTHFGGQAIHGVVRKVRSSGDDDSQR